MQSDRNKHDINKYKECQPIKSCQHPNTEIALLPWHLFNTLLTHEAG